MPFSVIRDSHVWACLVSAETGALVHLVDAWWQSGGLPLPTDDARLMSLARCHLARWSAIKARVMWAWREIEPTLGPIYTTTIEHAQTRKLVSMKALASRRQQAQPGRRLEQSTQPGQAPSVQPGRLLPSKIKISTNTVDKPENGAPKRVIRSQNVGLLDKR